MTNPNGANGTTSDPREQIMWDIYVEKLSEGIENAYESAVEAGYEDATSRQITVRSWFIERKAKLKRKEMFSNAEKLLAKTIMYDHVDSDGKINVSLLGIQVKVSETLVKTLGKDEGYSERKELTGKDGKDLPIPILNVSNNTSNEESTEAK